jgi:hypothetical protein
MVVFYITQEQDARIPDLTCDIFKQMVGIADLIIDSVNNAEAVFRDPSL